MIVDLFSGPGGWGHAAPMLGLEPIGVEWDDAAVATSRAAGHNVVQADIGALDPARFVAERHAGNVTGLIASPPCQAFSMAGTGEGRRAFAVYEDAIRLMGNDDWGSPEQIAALDRASGDERGHLVLEPLRWALDLEPRWIALEQVPPVLPLWEAMAAVLRELGYSAWTGLLSSERYGVPQTRRRAILIASLDHQVGEPPATHQRYIAPRVKAAQETSLFDTGAPERIVAREDEHLEPWVSMAEALGWATTDKVGFPRLADDGAATDDGYRERDFRDATEPAAALTEKMRSHKRLQAGTNTNDPPAKLVTGDTKARSWTRDGGPPPPTHLDRRQTGGDGTPVKPVPTTEPAPTMSAAGLAAGRDVWTDTDEALSTNWPSANTTLDKDAVVQTNAYGRKGGAQARRTENGLERPVDEPAPTVDSQVRRWTVDKDTPTDTPTDTPQAEEWAKDRPATTVAGDPRVPQPGHKKDDASPDSPGRMEGAIRIDIVEAAILQSFPPDYPWQGSKSKQFQQVGNAIPPRLAFAVLKEATNQ